MMSWAENPKELKQNAILELDWLEESVLVLCTRMNRKN